MAKVYKAQTFGAYCVVAEIACTDAEIANLPTTVDDGVTKCCGYGCFGVGSAAITDTGKVYMLFESPTGWKEI